MERINLNLLKKILLFILLTVMRGIAGAHSISLEEAYDRTLASDQTIRIAYVEIKKANLLPWSALTKFGPRINVGYSLRHTETTTPFYNPSLSVNDAQNANISLNQPLIDFTFFPAYRLGKLTVNANRLQYQLTIRNVLFGVAKAYYEVLKQQKIVELDKTTLDLANRQLKLSQNQYEEGAVSKVDILRAQSSVESARQNLITDENLLELDRNTLSNTLNLHGKGRQFELIQPKDAEESIRSFEDELARAFANREDIKVGEIAIQQSKEARKEVLGQYAPTVSAQLAQNWDTNHSAVSRSEAWGAALTVQVPIFTGGQREIDLKTAGYNINEAGTNLETTQKDAESEVKTTWLEVENLRETIISLKTQVESNEQNYQDLQNQYLGGAATSLDTQTALIALVNSRTNLITQTYQYQVALRDLERAGAAFQNRRVKSAKIP